MKVTGLTHVGNVRSINEDTILIAAAEPPFYALVADGMGGHAAGEVASSAAAQAVGDFISRLGTAVLDEDQIVDAIQFANRQLLEDMQTHPEHLGMGTTLTFAYMESRSVTIGHVGDSGAYLASSEGLRKITRDHTYVQKLIDSGAIPAEAAADSPYRNVITRALGITPLQVDVYKVQWKPGDILLLCSDGLTAYADREYLHETLTAGITPAEMAERLLNCALAGGGRDNISVVVAENADGQN